MQMPSFWGPLSSGPREARGSMRMSYLSVPVSLVLLARAWHFLLEQ